MAVHYSGHIHQKGSSASWALQTQLCMIDHNPQMPWLHVIPCNTKWHTEAILTHTHTSNLTLIPDDDHLENNALNEKHVL